jgi:hypothetical protein
MNDMLATLLLIDLYAPRRQDRRRPDTRPNDDEAPWGRVLRWHRDRPTEHLAPTCRPR